MKFYRSLKREIIIVNIIVFGVLILSQLVSGKIERVMMCLIFAFSIAVSIFLIWYFKNNVADVHIENETIRIILNDKRIINYRTDQCTEIRINEYKIFLFFEGDQVFRIQRFYDLKRKDIFDFSIFNQNNFPNAKIHKSVFK